MGAQQDAQDAPVSVEAYLAGEQTGDGKHEYVHGVLYAMSGGTINHDRLANTIRATLRAHLQQRPCDVLGRDVRLRVARLPSTIRTRGSSVIRSSTVV